MPTNPVLPRRVVQTPHWDVGLGIYQLGVNGVPGLKVSAYRENRRLANCQFSSMIRLNVLPLASLIVLSNIANAKQSPFSTVQPLNQDYPQGLDSSWNLSTAQRPPANSSYNLIFDSVASLLQRWPNTRYRNGHNVVPGTIPAGTLLYHGRDSPTPPQVPEWVALDPDHSFLFTALCDAMDAPVNSTDARTCWHLTFTTTRALRVLYFDGSSAAKLPLLLRNRKSRIPENDRALTNGTIYPMMPRSGGTLDSQEFLLWGRDREDMLFRDGERIEDMCRKWGRGGSDVGDGEGFDGFVRMQMSFEIMLCDFNSTTNLVDALPLTSAGFPFDPDGPAPVSVMTSLIEAGSWHNFFPGETRISLDYHRLLSFFDPEVAPSLVQQRAHQARWEYRIRGIAEEDLQKAQRALRDVTLNDSLTPSGIDWKTLHHVITDRYSERLETIRDLLASPSLSRAHLKWTSTKVQSVLRVMLTPYITTRVVSPSSSLSTPEGSFKTSSSGLNWASPVFQHCSKSFTKFSFSSEVKFTQPEILMRDAIYHTNKEICRVITRMWARGMEAGLDPSLSMVSSATSTEQIEGLHGEWQEELHLLMNWLDWSIWVKCRPACGPEEMCYLPTWPLLDPIPDSHPRTGSAGPQQSSGTKGDLLHGTAEDDWLDPKPRCVRKVMPYNL